MKALVDIYRSKKKEGLYLYLKNGAVFSELPEALQQQFGAPEKSMTLVLTKDKKLAHANAEKVLSELDDKGYYLQLPPLPEAYMKKIPNDKLY